MANRQRAVRVSAAALRRAARHALRAEGAPRDVELSIAVVDDAAIRALNRRYRGEDRATDVLAFPQAPPGRSGPGLMALGGGQGVVLGDVVLSAERAAVQAAALGHSTARELALLVIHGVLHLLGYDDTAPAGARRMRARQEALLEAFYRRRRAAARGAKRR
ncbi:MAG: rRNA maturation RNase YbeY [Armatimonadota bacterium]|nr:rRNA maturation RNase YbeY [Armatimonadota bacterium]MDR7447910.1 rRNA maturation RNase YbeY [Armatimonadota bacterium]MDR7460641.1 rRNA maturation RNase YbeY [Armatimonadota bacterium]MDR7479742.1 rRNA maturation RNase YbeY [Armatimonadota bacterium]MDR7489474.1 rRNA maturation RNase YbeY [Armatimonadota bacterium]